MKVTAAITKEQGVTFTVVLVKTGVISLLIENKLELALQAISRDLLF